MVKHSDLAKSFVAGDTKGKASRMFIEGRAIFSYGNHFPISIRLKNNKWLFNKDKYSSSTSAHQRYVYSAISSVNGEIIECSTQKIKQAIDYPEETLVITNEVVHSSIDKCLENMKKIYKDKGIKRFPINKIKNMINDWEIIKSL